MTKYRHLLSQDAQQDELDAFLGLVQSGGAVDQYYVRQGILRPGVKIVFAEVDCEVVGVAALKIPSDQYRSGLQGPAKANFSLPQNVYPYELGYVSVSSQYAGNGIARKLVEKVLGLTERRGIFATTSHPAMKDHLLPSLDFVTAGKSWNNKANDVLNLMVRDATGTNLTPRTPAQGRHSAARNFS